MVKNRKDTYSPSYVSKNLGKEEKILVAEKINGWLYWPLCCGALYIALVGIFSFFLVKTEDAIASLILGLFFLCIALFCYFSSKAVEMVVTNKRVILKKGIFIHNTNELRLEKVESTNIKKSLLGLILGYGTIVFTGTGNKVIKFGGIDNPQKIKNEIDDIFDKYGK